MDYCHHYHHRSYFLFLPNHLFFFFLNFLFSSSKRKQYEGDAFTGGTAPATTLKLKYHNNAPVTEGGHSNMSLSLSMDETMKCIPEVSEADVEVLRGAGFGASRYGEVLLARFKDDNHHRQNHHHHHNHNRSWNHRTGNEVSSSETECGNDSRDKSSSSACSGTDETLVVLKTLEKEKLRPEFLHEMKSKWFISAKSERVAKLIGYLSVGGGGGGQQSAPKSMAMVLECGNCDLAHYLRTCDKKVVG